MDYLRENFYLTTSGVFRTQALLNTLLEVGSGRILYSVDYPYESMREWPHDSIRVRSGEIDRREIVEPTPRSSSNSEGSRI